MSSAKSRACFAELVSRRRSPRKKSRAGVSTYTYASLERVGSTLSPAVNPRLDTLLRVSTALSVDLAARLQEQAVPARNHLEYPEHSAGSRD